MSAGVAGALPALWGHRAEGLGCVRSEQNPGPCLGAAEAQAAGALPADPAGEQSDVGTCLGDRLQSTGLTLAGPVALPAVTWAPEPFVVTHVWTPRSSASQCGPLQCELNSP